MGLFDFSWCRKKTAGSSGQGAVTEWEIGPWIDGKTRSPNMPRYMARNPDGSHSFTFPASNGVHYVYRASGPLRVGGNIRLLAEITGNGEFKPVGTGDIEPCDLQLYIERSDNGWQAHDPFERMFTKAAMPLKFGVIDWTVPLTWEHWEGVVEHLQDEAKFKDCLARTKSVGGGFGGAMFAGHGVYVRAGNAQFTLRKYEVT